MMPLFIFIVQVVAALSMLAIGLGAIILLFELMVRYWHIVLGLAIFFVLLKSCVFGGWMPPILYVIGKIRDFPIRSIVVIYR